MQFNMFARTTDDGTKRSNSNLSRAPRMVRALGFTAKIMIGVAAAVLAFPKIVSATTTLPYPRMAAVDAYLMDPAQEIALAKSAAPDSISRNATVLILTRTGFETAVTGTNGFVCMVGRGFSGASDWPERWNPKIRAAECLNPPAARSVAPIARLRTAMILAGRTDADFVTRVESALGSGQLPPLEAGAMSYMMSKSAYLSEMGDHDMPHLMFFAPVEHAADWGANAPDTPVIGGDYWFLTPGHEAESAKLPTLSVFLVGAATWSDGTPAPAHRM